MQNRTDIIGVSLMERTRQLLRSGQSWLYHCAAILTGVVLSNSFILGGVSPFGVAFCAAVGNTYTLSAGIGAVLGYVITINPLSNMKYIAAVLLVAAAKWLFSARLPPQLRLISSATTCLLSLAVASTAVLITNDATLYDMVISAAEILLACGATYFFARTISLIGTSWHNVTRSDMSCMIIATAVVLMGFSSVLVGSLSVGRILAVLAILLCARYGREAGGAICGITVGMALGLVTGNQTYIVAAYAFGGLVAGVFGGMGRISTAASFIFINTITALFTMAYADVYNAIFEIFISTVLFIAIPHNWIAKSGVLTAIKPPGNPDTATQTALCEKLEDISTALGELSTTTQQVSEKLGAMSGTGLSVIYTKVAEQVCHYCGMRTTCWQYRYSDTLASMNDALAVLKRDGTISRDKMPKAFRNVCCKEEDFVAALNARFHDYVAKEGVQRKVSKVRGVVTDQFEGMSLMLSEIASDLGNIRLLNPIKARQVREYMEKQGIDTRSVFCYSDEFQRMIVEMQIPNYHVARLHKTKAALDLSTMLEADFDMPQVIQREKYASVQFSEKASFSVQVGAYQIAAEGNRLCGDAYDIIREKDGRSHFILSDGMGSGGSAAVDSAMATGLISRLLTVGIGHEAALKMVNSAMLLKSGEESLATIDICTMDLFTGKARFFKAGAAPTFVMKNGKAGYVESTSLPVGILRGVAFEQSSVTLHEGDWVVMVSDGVVATGSQWVLSQLESAGNVDIQRVCEQLATTAKLRRTDGREDDITVMAAVMTRGT